ncbi:MAG: OmpA family protein [Helicobacteraceae bacterium]|jgi:OOP family OmpA-OmpF porin|nr:OmpA family protein [Helicobacteraceae bacterium]
METNEPTLDERIVKEEKERKQSWRDLPPLNDDPELEELRLKLFRRELFIINKLKQMFDGGSLSANEMMKIISDSIVARAGKDERFLYAMSPMVEKIVAKSMKTRQQEFVDLLFPLMGPSIRRSIGENLRTMLNSFSQSLENSLSWRGLRWRLEAWRTGKSFSDVVLLHTIVYRVEEIFFVHCETGMALSRLARVGAENQDANMVGAMLSAINDFARDCFGVGASDNLETLHIGDYTIVIEKREKAYLACLARGTPPEDLRLRVRDALDRLLSEYDDQLSEFNGDPTPFQHAFTYLEPLLEERYVEEHKRFPTWGRAIAIAILLLICATLGFSYWRYLQRERNLDAARIALNAEPGILALGRGDTKNGRTRFTLLRDEYSRTLEETLAGNPMAAYIDPVYTSFISLEPQIVERRVKALVKPPEGSKVTIDFDGRTVALKGEAPLWWISSIKNVLEHTHGVASVDTSELKDPNMAQIVALVSEIEKIEVEFPIGKADPIDADRSKLQKAADMLIELEGAAAKAGLIPSLTIYGHADRTGAAKQNYEVSQARARTLAAMLYERGSNIQIETFGLGADYSKTAQGKPDQASRRIELRVRLLQSTNINY